MNVVNENRIRRENKKELFENGVLHIVISELMMEKEQNCGIKKQNPD